MSYYNRRKLIINEEEKVKILSLYGLLTEDLEEPSKQMTIKGNSFFENGMWKNMSQEGMSQLTKQLEKATEQANSLINSWAVVNNEAVGRETHFDPVIPNQNVMNERYGLNNNGASKEDYQKYGWLFGGIMK